MDLMGGTISMQDAGTRWLPQEPKETPEQYRRRLGRSVLYDGYRQTIEQAASRPFRNPITIAGIERFPESLRDFQDDVDLHGRSLTQYARDLTRDSMGGGMSLTLVEWSPGRERPYFLHLKPGSLYHWQVDRDTMDLVEIRFRMEEVRTKETGELESVEVVWRYFVADTGAVAWERYVLKALSASRSKAELEESGELLNRLGKPLTAIPLVAIYANRDDVLVAYPPYEGLADQNWRHWQSYSDLSNIMRYACIPMLLLKSDKYGRGSGQASDEDGKVKPQVNASAAGVTHLGSDDDMKYVEPMGEAIGHAMQDIESTEKKMEAAGASPLFRTGAQTATASYIDEQAREAGMTAFVRALEIGLTAALELAFAWEAEDVPEEMVVQVNEDRPLTAGREKRAALVLQSRKERLITNATAIIELQRDQILSEDIDPELETAKVSREAAFLVDSDAFPVRGDEFGDGVFEEPEGLEERGDDQ